MELKFAKFFRGKNKIIFLTNYMKIGHWILYFFIYFDRLTSFWLTKLNKIYSNQLQAFEIE